MRTKDSLKDLEAVGRRGSQVREAVGNLRPLNGLQREKGTRGSKTPKSSKAASPPPPTTQSPLSLLKRAGRPTGYPDPPHPKKGKEPHFWGWGV